MHETLDYITLTEAAKIAPNRPSTNCLWRWCRRGVLSRGGRRIRLRHVRIGGKLYTTGSWLQGFGEQLAQADAEHFDFEDEVSASLPRRPRTPSQKRRAAEIDQAERELKEAGV